MQCPSCGQHTPDSWKKLLVAPGAPPHRPARTELEVQGPFDTVTPREEHRPLAEVGFDWMNCANPKCGDLVIRMHETRDPVTLIDEQTGERTYGGLELVTTTSQVRPRFKSRPLPDEVNDPWRKDYLEAAAILVASPRMSAVLSRRILGDLLEQYAGLSQFRLEDRVDAFIADETRPREIRENLHYFREIANFGAHTQKDDQQEIIDVTEEEAEWTLDILDSLFEHFIVVPARDHGIRESIAAKIAKAGRTPITPLPPDPGVTS